MNLAQKPPIYNEIEIEIEIEIELEIEIEMVSPTNSAANLKI